MGKILVVGSTGTIGRSLVNILREAGEHVLAATSKPQTYTAQAGVTPVLFNHHDASTYDAALDGVDRVFLLSPGGYLAAHELLGAFVQAAAQDKSRKFVLMTADGVQFNPDAPLRRLEMLIEQTGSPFVFLRPNWFMDNFHTYWLMPIREAGMILLSAGEGATAFIDARDIAASAAAALRSSLFDGQGFSLSGGESLTYAQAAAILSQATGRTIRYQDVDDATFIQNVMQAGIPQDYAQQLAALLGFVKQGHSAAVSPAVEQLTGRAPITLAQYARDYAAHWQPQGQTATEGNA